MRYSRKWDRLNKYRNRRRQDKFGEGKHLSEEVAKKPFVHNKLITGLSLVAWLLVSLLLLFLLLLGTYHLVFIFVAWLIGLSLGFLAVVLRPTDSIEFSYKIYWGRRLFLVLLCMFLLLVGINLLEAYTIGQLEPEVGAPLIFLAIIVACMNGAIVYYLGRRSL